MHLMDLPGWLHQHCRIRVSVLRVRCFVIETLRRLRGRQEFEGLNTSHIKIDGKPLMGQRDIMYAHIDSFVPHTDIGAFSGSDRCS